MFRELVTFVTSEGFDRPPFESLGGGSALNGAFTTEAHRLRGEPAVALISKQNGEVPQGARPLSGMACRRKSHRTRLA